jgi:hypothetical protein
MRSGCGSVCLPVVVDMGNAVCRKLEALTQYLSEQVTSQELNAILPARVKF